MIAVLAEHFALPAVWPLLACAPLAWFALRALETRRERRLARVLGVRAPRLTAELSRQQQRWRRRLFAAGLLAATVALMQPLLGTGSRRLEQRGIDLVVCLDVSRSMLARDAQPSRLLAARREIRALAERARGDRLALVAFAGEARLVAPRTQDVDSLLELLEQTDTVAVRRGGTDLGAALQCALAALGVVARDGSGGRPATGATTGDHEAIVLVTDGEDHEQRGQRQAEVCREHGITVHCVGVGSARGSKVAVETARGEAFLRDKSGYEVVSAMDAHSLRRITETTGGDFIEMAASTRPLIDLYERRIVPMARKALLAEQRRERENRFQWPLLAALVLWMLDLLLTHRARRA